MLNNSLCWLTGNVGQMTTVPIENFDCVWRENESFSAVVDIVPPHRNEKNVVLVLSTEPLPPCSFNIRQYRIQLCISKLHLLEVEGRGYRNGESSRLC